MMRNLFLWLLLASSTVSAEARLQPFVSDSMTTIESRYSGRAFVVALWSVTCLPCLHELELLASWSDKNPNIPLVLIATDGQTASTGVTQKLKDVGLDQADNWIYADDYVEKLRFNIDPTWRGELPRSYLYSSTTERRAISGALTLEKLQGYFGND